MEHIISQHATPNTHHSEGISLIALIITIVVLIILASITIFNGLNTPRQAGFAKFVTEISDVETAVMEKYHDAESQGIIQGRVKSPEQIYYCVANDLPISSAPAIPTKTDDVSSLGALYGNSLKGTEYYEINNSNLIPANKTFYGDDETQYLTNAGEIFILPGYKMEENGETRWYIDEKTYYVGEANNAGSTTVNLSNYRVGEVVDYHPTVTSHSLDITLTGADESATIYTEGDAPWRILSIEGNTIKITPGVVNSQEVTLQGVPGYFTGAQELNNVCEALYSKGSIKAHSMTVDELAKASDNAKPSDWSQYDTATRNVVFYPKYTEGTTETSLVNTTYHTNVPSGYEITEETNDTITLRKGEETITYTKKVHDNNTYNFYTGNGMTSERMYGGKSNGTQNGHACIQPYSEMVGNDREYHPVFIRGTYYSFNPMGRVPALENVIGGSNTDRGWLASPCVYVHSSNAFADFYMRLANAGYVGAYILANSIGDTSTPSWGLLPVVNLTSSHLTGTGSIENSSADPGSAENPWGIK